MGIAIACPTCGARMEYQDADAGRNGQCPTCKGEVHIPLRLMQCLSCRRQFGADLTSCPACGTALVSGAGAIPVAAPAMPTALPSARPQTSGKAIASLVLGLLALPTACVTGVPAIIMGAIALGDIRRSAGALKGHGMATTGIIFGSIGSTLTVCALLLFPLTLPAVQMAREAARRTQCRNNLKQIGIAMQNYHDAWGSFPPPYMVDTAGRPLLSWRVLLLPYLDEQDLYDTFHLNEPWDSPHNMSLSSRVPYVFTCPSDDQAMPTATTYVAITGPGTMFPFDHQVTAVEVTDGLTETAMVGELKGSSIIWSKPDDLVLNAQFRGARSFSSNHPGGWNMLFGDGSVRFVPDSISHGELRAMMTIAGGETVQSLDD